MQAPTERTGTDRERTVVASTDLDRDQLFGLLQSGRRRRVARHLLGFVGEAVPVDALATAVARREYDAPADGLDPEVRERVAVALDHSHLPQLDAAGVVDYDRNRGCVTATPRIEALEPHLEVDPGGVETDRSAEKLALAGFVGGSLATLLATVLSSRKRVAGGLGVGLLVGASLLWAAARDDREQST